MSSEERAQQLFVLEPQYHERVWGGQRLRPQSPPVGEAWVAYEDSRVRCGPQAGRTVRDLAQEYGQAFLGTDVHSTCNGRFPLLIKLLDCADWLSVQVHPNDEQARRLVGPDEYGKTEAWHFLQVEDGASILAGVRPGTTREALARAIRGGRVLDVARRLEVREAESVFIPAGTLHALGPGLLLYEVQQVCDTTYRVYDWDRPASAGRKLHLEESVEVTDPRLVAQVTGAPDLRGTGAASTVTCEYFTLEVLNLQGDALVSHTGGVSAHTVTVTEGEVEVTCGAERVTLGVFETVLVAGSAGSYVLRSVSGTSRALRSSVPVPA